MAVRHRPQHARPSLLATNPSTAGLTGVVLLAVLGVAISAAILGAPAGAVARQIHRPASAAPQLPVATGESEVALPPADRALLQGAVTSTRRPAPHDTARASALALDGIPLTALQAYRAAAAREAGLDPACALSWPLLAAIGRVESDHGRFAGAVLHSDGLSTLPVIGIALNGHGTALIRDTDHGRLDGDTIYDHAVGPMQFIPSTWAAWGVDASHDGRADPFNIFDATAAAAGYLCAAGGDLSTLRGQLQAVLSYNDSWHYAVLVLSLERVYAAGVGVSVPVLPATPTRPHRRSHLPPVNPGPPGGASTARHRSSVPSESPTASSSAPAIRTTCSATPSSSPPTSSNPATSSSPPTSSSSATSSTSTTPTPSPTTTTTGTTLVSSATSSASPSCP